VLFRGSALVVLFSAGVLASSTAVSAQDLQLQISPELLAAEQAPGVRPIQVPDRPRAARLVYITKPRPSWVIPMHAATAILQGLDAHSTFTAFDAGAVEGNPLVATLAHHRPAFAAFKAGVTAGLIYATDKMSRRHPVRAFITSAAINTAYSLVAMHNYRVASRASR
jgi:hypothetical protein